MDSSTNGSQDVRSAPFSERLTEFVIIGIIAVMGFVGNLSLWIIVLSDRQLRTVFNWTVLCLSAADLIVSVVNMPFIMFNLWIGGWVLPESACVALGFVSMLAFIASVLSLASISWNRYMSICHMTKCRVIYRKRNASIMIAAIWIVSSLLSLPPLLGWGRYAYLPGQSICFCEWRTSVSYTFFMVLVCFGGPCSVMAFCYIRIVLEIQKSKRRLQDAGRDAAANGNARFYVTSQRLKNIRRLLRRKQRTGSDQQEQRSERNSGHCEVGTAVVAPPPSEASAGAVDGRQRTSPKPEADGRHVEPASLTSIKSVRTERKRREEIKLTRTFLVVILTFIVLWLPFCVTMFMAVFGRDGVPRPADMATITLGCFNSCCNPVIYGIMNKRFRNGYARLYCALCGLYGKKIEPLATDHFSATI